MIPTDAARIANACKSTADLRELWRTHKIDGAVLLDIIEDARARLRQSSAAVAEAYEKAATLMERERGHDPVCWTQQADGNAPCDCFLSRIRFLAETERRHAGKK